MLIEPALADLGFSCVRIRYKAGGGRNARGELQIMAEPDDAREMTVEDCAQISRHVATVLDVDDPIKEAYTLEVSSPGLDRPLTREQDFTRFSGEMIKVTLQQMRDGQKRYKGRLSGRDDKGLIHLETDTGRISFTFDEIDTAKIDTTEFFSTLKQPARTLTAGKQQNKEV